jgi:hypothetical protein
MRGRHARVPSVAGVVSAVRAMPGPRRARLCVAGGAGLLVALGAAFAVSAREPSSRPEPKAVAVNVLDGRPAQAPVTRSHPRRPVRAGDQAALAFYERHDPARAAHVTEVVWTGPMLRVYTDLPASDADSRTAIALCETAAAYAEGTDRLPAVFVHANRAAGYPVLANKMTAGDDCRLGRVP